MDGKNRKNRSTLTGRVLVEYRNHVRLRGCIVTVGELRKVLESEPDNMLVLRGDNSGGWEAIYSATTQEVVERDSSEFCAVVLE